MTIKRSLVELVHDEGYGNDLLFHLNSAIKGKDMLAERVLPLCPQERGSGDRLAYVCAKAILRGDIRTRSAIDDALLDYLNIGGICGPPDVPTWIEQYEFLREEK